MKWLVLMESFGLLFSYDISIFSVSLKYRGHNPVRILRGFKEEKLIGKLIKKIMIKKLHLKEKRERGK